MTVITSARIYAFDFVPTSLGLPPYEVRFRYPTEGGAEASAPEMGEQIGEYHLSGTRSLWPTELGDDGAKTYIGWAADVPLPVVLFIDGHGQERLANGYMRGNYYVLDSAYDQLLFRIDLATRGYSLLRQIHHRSCLAAQSRREWSNSIRSFRSETTRTKTILSRPAPRSRYCDRDIGLLAASKLTA